MVNLPGVTRSGGGFGVTPIRTKDTGCRPLPVKNVYTLVNASDIVGKLAWSIFSKCYKIVTHVQNLDTQKERQKWIQLLSHFTCTDLAQPSMVTLTVHIIPRPTPFFVMHFEFSTGFYIIFIVWLAILPVLEIQLQQRTKQIKDKVN